MIKTGNTNFWKAQIIGWGLVGVCNFLLQQMAGLSLKLVAFNSISSFLAGLIVTTVFRYFIYRKNWKHWELWKLLTMILLSTILLTVSFLLIVFLSYGLFFPDPNIGVLEVLGNGFFFAIVMLTWNAIYFSIHYFNHWSQSEVEKWKLKAEMREAQLGSLKAQINPHFVFNALNNIRSLILEDKEKARAMLLNFSDLFRYSLQNNEHIQVTLEKELEMVKQYTELLSIQYEDKLRYKIEVEPGLEGFKMPPMMLQLLVENAVKHGISQYKDGGSIFININKKDGLLHIKVKNTGSLKTSARLGDQLGVGLENIRERLRLIYHGNAELTLHEINNFVEASIKLPLT